MQKFFTAFQSQAAYQPGATALQGSGKAISYSGLQAEIRFLRKILLGNKVHCLALALPNCPAWVAVDLAAASLGIPLLPVPHFFTSTQISHLLADANADHVICGKTLLDVLPTLDYKHQQILGEDALLVKLSCPERTTCLPPGTVKVSYTSGTTAEPRGVIVPGQSVDTIITSLVQAIGGSRRDRHLVSLPFSLLLENIAGVYAVLAVGGQCMVPDFAALGMIGSSFIDAEQFLSTISEYAPTTLITVPATTRALVSTVTKIGFVPPSLRFIAVGGAPLSRATLHQARESGLPLFEGYGLTECTSVVTMNTPWNFRDGSAGKPLPHASIDISPDGQIQVSGALCTGYLGTKCSRDHYWQTGDLGYLDEDGFLFITARQKTAYSTEFGRNVSPEWVESELLANPAIGQVLVHGEGRPYNLAIVVPGDHSSDAAIAAGIDNVNHKLPDYARIGTWIRAHQPFGIDNQQLGLSGIMRREQIVRHYQDQIMNAYQF